MTLDELIDIVDAAYGGGLVKAYRETDNNPGQWNDLAKFVAIELDDTFNPRSDTLEQLRSFATSIQCAIDQLQAVHDALETELTTEEAHLKRGETP